MIVTLSVFSSLVLYYGMFLLSGQIALYNRDNTIKRVLFIILLPVLVAAFRYDVGYDFGSYLWGFELSAFKTLEDIFSNIAWKSSVGVSLCQYVGHLFDSSEVFWGVACAAQCIPGVIYILKDWDDDKNLLSMFVFCYFAVTYSFGLSALKQGIAMSICLLSIMYIYKRQLVKFCLCILAAVAFHNTAIVFLPTYFLLNSDNIVSKWKKISAVLITILSMVFLGFILSYFADGKFEGYATNEVFGNNYMFIVYSFWSLVFLYFREDLISIDKRNDLLILLYIIGNIFVYLGFTNAFTKRIAEYFVITQIMLMPQLVFVVSENSRDIVKILIISYYVLLALGFAINAGYSAPIPYRFIL